MSGELSQPGRRSGFSRKQMKNSIDFTHRIAIAYYGHPFDTQLFSGYVAEYGRLSYFGETTMQYFSGLLFDDDAFIDRFNTDDHSQFIDQLYLKILGRTADVEGKQYYLSRLDQDPEAIKSLPLDFMMGARNDDAMVIEKKVQVATLLSDQLLVNNIDLSEGSHLDSLTQTFDTISTETDTVATVRELIHEMDGQYYDQITNESIVGVWQWNDDFRSVTFALFESGQFAYTTEEYTPTINTTPRIEYGTYEYDPKSGELNLDFASQSDVTLYDVINPAAAEIGKVYVRDGKMYLTTDMMGSRVLERDAGTGEGSGITLQSDDGKELIAFSSGTGNGSYLSLSYYPTQERQAEAEFGQYTWDQSTGTLVVNIEGMHDTNPAKGLSEVASAQISLVGNTAVLTGDNYMLNLVVLDH